MSDIRKRVTAARNRRDPWWDWGHRTMVLLSRDPDDDNDTPRGRDLWWIPPEYVEGITALLVADFDQRFGCYITTRYDDVRATANDIDWRIYDLQDDGRTVKVGLWPNRPEHGGRLQPLPTWESLNVNLFLWWYVWQHKGKAQWFGLRRWLYYKALHAAVHQKKPFTCQQVPARDSGGYDHWHCTLPRKHSGDHRFRNYVWGDNGAKYAPLDRTP